MYPTVGSRFLLAMIGTFLATLVILAGAGFAVVAMTVPQPRDPFRAGAFEFDLAPGWWCELEGTEYVCNPPGKAPYSAIAVIATKQRNKDDNLAAYEDHLKQSQQVTDVAGSSTMSVVSYVKRVKLGDAEWIEALHLGSEIPHHPQPYHILQRTPRISAFW